LPDQAASLQSGHVAATRTGLPPASDDELTNHQQIRYVTELPPVLLGARISEAGNGRDIPMPYSCHGHGTCTPTAHMTGKSTALYHHAVYCGADVQDVAVAAIGSCIRVALAFPEVGRSALFARTV
jgi:hypothetical protein